MTDLKKMRKLSSDKLIDKLKDCYDSITTMRFQKVLGDLEHPQKIRQAKKEIAQIKTILREQELASKESN